MNPSQMAAEKVETTNTVYLKICHSCMNYHEMAKSFNRSQFPWPFTFEHENVIISSFQVNVCSMYEKRNLDASWSQE